jgi:PAS domain S-box-containing protein
MKTIAQLQTELDAAHRRIAELEKELEVSSQQEALNALRESEERFRHAMGSITEVFYIVDVINQQLLYVSPAYSLIWGKSMESLYTDPASFADGIDEEQRPTFFAMREKQLRGHVTSQEYRITRPDGSKRWIYDQSFPIFGAEKKVTQVTGIAQDISERKLVEMELRESEARYRLLAENMSETVWLMDKDLKYIYASPSVEQRRGFTIEELNSIPLEQQMTAESYQLVAKTIAEAFSPENLQSPTPHLKYTLELELFHKNGSSEWSENDFTIVLDASGKPAQIMGSGRTISQRKATEKALAASEKRLHSIIDSAIDAIISVDKDQRVIIFNTAAEKMFGYQASEALGKPLTTFLPERFHAQHEKNVFSLSESPNRRQERYTVTGRKKNGEEIPLETAFSFVEIEGEFVYTAIVHDISERIQAESSLQARTQELTRLVDAGRELSETLDSDQIYNIIYHHIRAALPCDMLIISSFDHQTELLTCEYLNTEEGPQDVSAYPRIPLEPPGKGTQSLVIRSGESMLLPDYVSAVRTANTSYTFDENGKIIDDVPEDAETTRSAIIVPLKAGGIVTGALQVFSTKRNAHTPDHLRFVEAFAFRASSALSNARLFAELENRVQERTAEIETIRRRLELATQAAELGVWDWNIRTGRLLWDAQVYKLYGVNEGTFDGTIDAFIKIVHPDDVADLMSFTQNAAMGASHTQVQYRVVRSDESVVYVKAHGVILYGSDGKPEHIVGVIQDITQEKLAESVLRESEERYRKAISAADAVPYSLDYASNNYTFIGDGIEKITGYNRLEMSPKLFDAIIKETSMHGELSRLKTHEATKKVRAGDQAAVQAIWRSDFQIKHKNGELRWLSDISVQRLDIKGKPIGSIGILQDITERKRAEQALRASEETYRALFENNNDAIFLIDPQGIFVRVNPRCEELLGYSSAELVGHHAHQFIRASQRKDEEKRFERLLSGEYVPVYERKFVRKDGAEIDTEVNISLIRDDNRQAKLIQSVVRDITGRKKTDQALRQSEEQNRLLFEESPDAVILINPDGLIVRANRAFEALSQIPREKLLDFSGEQLGPVESQTVEMLRQKFTASIQNQETYAEAQFVLLRPDGSQRDVESRSFMLEIDGSNHLLVTSRDISAHKQAEETLRMANAEMERALRLKDEFLANMSHELRTPLNAIIGISESLGEQISGPLNPKQLRYINVVHESGLHLLNLINDILDLSKIEAGKITLDINRINLKAICESSMRMVKEMAIKKNQSLTLTYDEKVDIISGDERRLKQMIVNLLSNAVKFTPENGKLGVEVKGDPIKGQVTIAVWDTGIGISERDLSRLFQPFVQLNAGLTREQSGTGLGLALVSEMARMHGGSISVESQPQMGSRFTLTLPWINAKPKTGPLVQLQEAARQTPSAPGHENQAKALILLVEDTEAVSMVIADFLESLGYKMVLARDGMEGIAAAKRLRPDLILMDVQMPIMDGLEATQKIRAEAGLEHTPIIALTALAMTGDRERCFAAGMNEYLSKPLHLKELAEVIQRLLPFAQGDPA